MIETKKGRPTKHSRTLSYLRLRAEDIRQYARVFVISDAQAAEGMINIGIKGSDITALQPGRDQASIRDKRGEVVSRREAARRSTNFLTQNEVNVILKISE